MRRKTLTATAAAILAAATMSLTADAGGDPAGTSGTNPMASVWGDTPTVVPAHTPQRPPTVRPGSGPNPYEDPTIR